MTHPDIVAGMEDYHSGEVIEFVERLSNSANLPTLDNELNNRIVDLLVEVADTPGLFVKLYKIILQKKLILNVLFITINEMLECSDIEKAKELLNILIETKNEDNNEDNGH